MEHSGPVLYQVRVSSLLPSLGIDRLDQVPVAYLRSLADAGFDVVYLLGVWQTGEAGLVKSREVMPAGASVASSPFAVKAYTVAKEYGGDAALKALRTSAHAVGLKLVVDFVPNHVGLDNDLILTHPDFLVHGTDALLKAQPQNYFKARDVCGPYLGETSVPDIVLAHGRDPNFAGWSDTVQLNYWNKGLRAYMTDTLVRIARELADGVRCDMAMLVNSDYFWRTWGEPNGLVGAGTKWTPTTEEFWPTAVTTTKAANPEFLFIAEVYDVEYDLQQMGFDFTYDKRLLDRLEAVDGRGVVAHLQADMGFQCHSARFIENHDEARAVTAFTHGQQHHFAAATVFATVPGLRFFHDGQLEGRRVFHSMHLGPRDPEAEDPDVVAFYTSLLSILRRPTFRTGTWRQATVHPSDDGNTSFETLVAHVWEPRTATTTEGGAGTGAGTSTSTSESGGGAGGGGAGAGAGGSLVPVAASATASALTACSGGGTYLVLVNIGTDEANGHIQFTEGTPFAGRSVVLVDVLGSSPSYVRTAEPKGIWFNLAPFAAHVYSVTLQTRR